MKETKEIEMQNNEITELSEKIVSIVNEAKTKIASGINATILFTNWNIGKYIVEFEQDGNAYAKYGKNTLGLLSKRLTLLLGKGYSRPNLNNMRLYYLRYPDLPNLSDTSDKFKLSWSHICELIKIEDNNERSFYEKETINAHWDVRSLQRQIKSSLYLRLAASTDKKGIMKLSQKGITVDKPENVIRDSYTVEFLGLPPKKRYSEKDLEKAIIDNLQTFLLELGRGFTFVGRQYKITIDNRNYYIDLVFYHRILKCFVLIDLKRQSVKHQDIGQMNMYLGYFAKEENVSDDKPPVGIILCREKDELMVEYATYGIDSQIFVSKYELYLPKKEELQAVVNGARGAVSSC